MGQHRRVAAAALAGILALAAPAVADAAPSQLKVNGAANPLGIDSPPRFSWEANVGAQSAYELEVSKGSTVVWDSGKVASSDDLDIPYAGPRATPPPGTAGGRKCGTGRAPRPTGVHPPRSRPVC